MVPQLWSFDGDSIWLKKVGQFEAIQDNIRADQKKIDQGQPGPD